MTRPVPADAETKVVKGVSYCRVKVADKWQWFVINANGRYRQPTGPYRATIIGASGRRETITLTHDKESSRAMLADRQRQASRIRAGIEIPTNPDAGMDIAKTLERYRREYLSRLLPVSRHVPEKALAEFIKALKPQVAGDLAGLTGADISRWHESIPKKAAGTIRNKNQAVRVFLKWLMAQGIIQSIPPFPKPGREGEDKRRAITLVEVTRFCRFAPTEWGLLVKLAFYSLARRGSLFLATAKDIHIGTALAFTIRPETDKTRTGRVVPLPELMRPVLKAIVKRYPRGFLFSDINEKNLARKFPLLAKDAGIPIRTAEGKFCFHGLRHGGASHLHANGIDLILLARLGGWTDLKMLAKRYSHVKPMNVAGAIESAWKG